MPLIHIFYFFVLVATTDSAPIWRHKSRRIYIFLRYSLGISSLVYLSFFFIHSMFVLPFRMHTYRMDWRNWVESKSQYPFNTIQYNYGENESVFIFLLIFDFILLCMFVYICDINRRKIAESEWSYFLF